MGPPETMMAKQDITTPEKDTLREGCRVRVEHRATVVYGVWETGDLPAVGPPLVGNIRIMACQRSGPLVQILEGMWQRMVVAFALTARVTTSVRYALNTTRPTLMFLCCLVCIDFTSDA